MDIDMLKEKWEIVLAVLGFLVTLFLKADRAVRRQRFWNRVGPGGALLYSGLVLGIVGVVFAGSRIYHNWYYETGPAPYGSIGAAVEDGCVVVQSYGGILYGEENWESFLSYERKGVPNTVRIAVYDAGAIRVVNDLLYDGKQYHYTINTRYIHQDSETTVYPYLLYLVYEPLSEEGREYTLREFWVLTEDPDLTAREMDSLEYILNEEYATHRLICETEWLPENKIFSPDMFSADANSG